MAGVHTFDARADELAWVMGHGRADVDIADDSEWLRTIGVAGYRVEAGWLTVFVFAPTAGGVVDLVAFLIEWVGTEEIGAQRVLELAGRPAPELPHRGLTSRQVRSAANYGGLVSRARQELATHIAKQATLGAYTLGQMLGSSPVEMGRRTSDTTRRRLARIAVDYDELIMAGAPRPRARLAERNNKSEAAIKELLRRAKTADLWASNGPGKRGQATQLARQLATETDDKGEGA